MTEGDHRPEDHSHIAVGDMLEELLTELHARVALPASDFQIVAAALTLAANNGRIIGMREIAAQAIQQGLRIDVQEVPGTQAASTLRELLGDD